MVVPVMLLFFILLFVLLVFLLAVLLVVVIPAALVAVISRPFPLSARPAPPGDRLPRARCAP